MGAPRAAVAEERNDEGIDGRRASRRLGQARAYSAPSAPSPTWPRLPPLPRRTHQPSPDRKRRPSSQLLPRLRSALGRRRSHSLAPGQSGPGGSLTLPRRPGAGTRRARQREPTRRRERRPRRLPHRRPVHRLANEAHPSREVRGQQVGLDRLQAREDAEQLHDQRAHERGDDCRGRVAGRRRKQRAIAATASSGIR